jgi:ribosomal protein S18 acetylase RimI-like enzyme
MTGITHRPAAPADFEAIAEFIVRLNSRVEQRCLHCGESAAMVTKALRELGRPPAESIGLAMVGDRIVGLVGADLAVDLGRGWLWGPYADCDDPLTLCDRLLKEFLAKVPDEVRVIDTFLGPKNLFLEHLSRHHEFGSPRTVHLYRADRPEHGYPRQPAPSAPRPGHLASLRALHDTAFPNTWRTAEEMLETTGPAHALFVHESAGTLDGYVYTEADPVENAGHVHFLAVAPGSRGQGLGRRLLSQALDWCFNERSLPSVSLTVLDTLVNARALYESAGFRLADSGVTLRRTGAPFATRE